MDRLKLLYSKEKIQKRIEELGKEISDLYNDLDEPVVLVCILKGAFIFFADLVRELKFKFQPEIDFVRIASYGKSDESGKIVFSKDLEVDIKGKHVLIIEDIVDTGKTLDFFIKELKKREPVSIKLCVLVDKKERQEKKLPIDFCGFEVEKGFLVGYGLDYAEKYRCLDGIYEVILDS